MTQINAPDTQWDIGSVGSFDTNDYFGFVYFVVNHTNAKMYIGQKQFWSFRRCRKTSIRCVDKLKVRKTTRIVRTESDWKTYTTSSTQVNKDIAHGHHFSFHIQSLHKSKSSLTYGEVQTIIFTDALTKRFEDGTRMFYNQFIPSVRCPPRE
jgi:hypothetical protein